MDILLPYNAWRLLYLASGSDGQAVRAWREQAVRGELQLPPAVLEWFAARVDTASVSDEQTLQTIRSVHKRYGSSSLTRRRRDDDE